MSEFNKVYLVFGGACYYSAGGARDYLGIYADISEAKEFAKRIIGKTGFTYDDDGESDDMCYIEWSHVFDLESSEIVAKYGERPYGRSFDSDIVRKIV